MASAANPQNWGMTRQDLENPLAYTQSSALGHGMDQPPRDTGGWFTLDQLYNRLPGAVYLHPGPGALSGGRAGVPAGPPRFEQTRQAPPDIFQIGSGAPSTNNWRLLGNDPSFIVRNGYLIQRGLNAALGLPAGDDSSFGDTAEQSIAHAHRSVPIGSGGQWGVPQIQKGMMYWPGQVGLIGSHKYPMGA
jgi:hypothetical protein